MNTDNTEYIDEVLREFEDAIHEEISDRITIARIKLQKISNKNCNHPFDYVVIGDDAVLNKCTKCGEEF